MRNFDLKRFRKDNNLKQSDLQEMLGVAQSFISKVENGKEAFPPLHYKTLKEKYGEDIVKKYKIEDRKFNNRLDIIGDGNIANAGNIGGDAIFSIKKEGNDSFVLSFEDEDFVIPEGLPSSVHQKIIQIIARTNRIQEENEQLKKDKTILQEFITMLQSKNKN
ncbi:helix-turn-helix domain-containing protein [Dysgonomonas sp. GY617]|uniref:helix-turn-helix domain-containing protein n=1 Tax=Dysgonomonas sp. GY617 TaxID=2780420 RepID=UPI001883FE54|nr:helix-turn-helix transcriptional regulator [Dysgonomonas sp. GY617]MBF0577702.1 helix-turn-helix transcriptional regulator [Dysgonomonas sp. GY617]